MLCCPQHKDRNYFKVEGIKVYKKEKEKLHLNSTLNNSQSKYKNFDLNFNCVDLH